MTDISQTSTRADAQFLHDEWDRRTRAHDIAGLVELYAPDATLESPLVPRILDRPSGVLRGHDELRLFFVRGTEGRPNDLVRWYCAPPHLLGLVRRAAPARGGQPGG